MKLKDLLVQKFLTKYKPLYPMCNGLETMVDHELSMMFKNDTLDERDLVKLDKKIRTWAKDQKKTSQTESKRTPMSKSGNGLNFYLPSAKRGDGEPVSLNKNLIRYRKTSMNSKNQASDGDYFVVTKHTDQLSKGHR